MDFCSGSPMQFLSGVDTSTIQGCKGGVQIGKIVWMDLRPHLRKG
jgi:hypothetical protein